VHGLVPSDDKRDPRSPRPFRFVFGGHASLTESALKRSSAFGGSISLPRSPPFNPTEIPATPHGDHDQRLPLWERHFQRGEVQKEKTPFPQVLLCLPHPRAAPFRSTAAPPLRRRKLFTSLVRARDTSRRTRFPRLRLFPSQHHRPQHPDPISVAQATP